MYEISLNFVFFWMKHWQCCGFKNQDRIHFRYIRSTKTKEATFLFRKSKQAFSRGDFKWCVVLSVLSCLTSSKYNFCLFEYVKKTCWFFWNQSLYSDIGRNNGCEINFMHLHVCMSQTWSSKIKKNQFLAVMQAFNALEMIFKTTYFGNQQYSHLFRPYSRQSYSRLNFIWWLNSTFCVDFVSTLFSHISIRCKWS